VGVDKFIDNFAVGVNEREGVIGVGIFSKREGRARVVSEITTSRDDVRERVSFVFILKVAAVEVYVFRGGVIKFDKLFRGGVRIVSEDFRKLDAATLRRSGFLLVGVGSGLWKVETGGVWAKIRFIGEEMLKLARRQVTDKSSWGGTFEGFCATIFPGPANAIDGFVAINELKRASGHSKTGGIDEIRLVSIGRFSVTHEEKLAGHSGSFWKSE